MQSMHRSEYLLAAEAEMREAVSRELETANGEIQADPPTRRFLHQPLGSPPRGGARNVQTAAPRRAAVPCRYVYSKLCRSQDQRSRLGCECKSRVSLVCADFPSTSRRPASSRQPFW